MTTLTDTETDWRKYAAAATQSDEEIEKAFLDQAWVTLQSKARPLMVEGLRVGFEVVHKNAENTRMVGVFVFRIDKDYLYAPVFFLNGNIKGTDLLYRATPKQFVPLNNEWCDYLVQLRTSQEGSGVPRTQRSRRRNTMNLLDIAEPPSMHRGGRKFASVADDATESDLVLIGVADMLEKLAEVTVDDESVLRRFITRHGGHTALQKLATTAQHDFEFAQALMLGSCPENYMPEIDAPQTKQASGPVLSVHTSVLKNVNVKQATARDMCRGWLIEDHRPEAQKSAAVYADVTTQLQSISEPGVCDVLLADGSMTPCLVGYPGLGSNKAGYIVMSGQVGMLAADDPCLVVVRKDTKASGSRVVSGEGQLYGECTGKLADDDQLVEPDSAQAGKAYRMLDVASGKFSQPFLVTKVETDPASGLKSLWGSDWDKDTSEPDPRIINPAVEGYDRQAHIIGNGIKLVEVGFELKGEPATRIHWDSNVGTGSLQSLLEFVFENGTKQASVIYRANGRYQVKTARSSQQWSPEYSELSATVRLMLDCALTEDAATGVLKQAEAAVEVAQPFFYDGNKQAHNLRFNDWPEFYENTNDEFGVLEAADTKHILPVDYDEPEIREHRVGDVWRQEGDGGDTLDTATPMQLYELSQQKGMGSLFEHGVVGELVKSYDSISMIQSYTPDLEAALDRLGRILFLLYWKPEDFAKAYGSDDQTSLENQLVSNFRSLGDLVLELLQKAQATTDGSVSMV